jgi:predicted aminopeptidase
MFDPILTILQRRLGRLLELVTGPVLALVPESVTGITLVVLVVSSGITSCADIPYNSQIVKGHLDVIKRREDIDDLLKGESISPLLRERLQLVGAAREFAFSVMQLPQSGSYTTYVDLQRNYVVKNLFAAPEFSTQLKTWCYPIVGCTGYRGYFDETMLSDDMQALRDEGYDVHVGNVAAYSTLGWFDDPILNTAIYRSESRLIGLIFHELSHQQLYIENDTIFNESFATAVQRAGLEQWYSRQGKRDEIDEMRTRNNGRELALEIITATRRQLAELYRQDLAEDEIRRQKDILLNTARDRYEALEPQLARASGFDFWFSGELNNAKLGSVAAYHQHVQAFLKVLEHNNGQFVSFYQHAKRLGKLKPEKRNQCLASWSESVTGTNEIPEHCF